MYTATKSGRLQIIAMLLSKGAEIDIKNHVSMCGCVHIFVCTNKYMFIILYMHIGKVHLSDYFIVSCCVYVCMYVQVIFIHYNL